MGRCQARPRGAYIYLGLQVLQPDLSKGIINHANLVHQFSKALSRIGSVLPRTRLSAELYRTDHMKEAICSLYAHILLFFQKAVKWYNLGPAGRALSSLFKPFELHYED